ncbi:Uncharacterised protein [Legionella donaldsonii]|uniref:Uncharacterized protein n=1 Tax=Legionella donaldsonii TaxID=45060 RepID=A0A378JHA0_9GAMM|nr:hypothetical protein [Legionella donaldsonii]STX44040.1 Uncharacterised protein [Legionella donaldsonii]
MVWTQTRTAFQSELQAQKKAATWQSQQLSIAERRKKAQIAVHGQSFIQSVEELRAIVGANYGGLFEPGFWDDLVVKATAALKTPNEQTLGLFAAKVTYLTETLEQYPISNAIRGAFNTMGGAFMTLFGALIAVTSLCMAASAGCFAGFILAAGFLIIGQITTAVGVTEMNQNARFSIGSQLREINAFAGIVVPELAQKSKSAQESTLAVVFAQQPLYMPPTYGAFYQPPVYSPTPLYPTAPYEPSSQFSPSYVSE